MTEKFAARIFGGLVENYLDYFDSLKDNLRKANIFADPKDYLSSLLLYSLITFVGSIIAFTTLATISFQQAGYSFTLAILLSSVSTTLVFFLGYYYPSVKAKGIKAGIEKALPFAAFTMATTSSSGGNPVDIFKVLSLRGGIMGHEGEKIYRSVKTMGLSLTVALQKTAMRTPSPKFADLLWGMIAIITSGGNMETYLSGKTKSLMTQYRRSLNDYAKQISLFTEIYITLVIVGSLFFIVLIAIISPLAGANILLLQTFLVFFFVPLVSMGFVILLKTISPIE